MNMVPESVQRELAALRAQPERTIDFSDLPETQANDWKNSARAVFYRPVFYRPVKQQLTVRIDADVVAWLKSQGSGYQGRLNQILRGAMLGR